MTLYDTNRERMSQLLPEKHYAAFAWLDECWRDNKQFTVLEVFRTQERQYLLFLQGRDKQALGRAWARGIISKAQLDLLISMFNAGKRPRGKVVTETVNSMHTKRLACDVQPMNCSYEDLEARAIPYGITHPFTKAPFVDKPHFELDKVPAERPKPKIFDPNAAIRRLKRRAYAETNPKRRQLMLDRLKRYSTSVLP